MAQNLVEKIAQKYAVGLTEGSEVASGDYLSIQPAHLLTHDNTGAVMGKFKSIGATRMANSRQPMFALDHNVQDRSEANLKKYAGIEAFAKDMGVDFYPAGRGIGHQIMVEEGYAFPGTMAVASDSHANMYGGLGCLGTPIVRTDAAAIWATGRTWWQVPPVARVVLTGRLEPGISGKDVIVTLCGRFNQDEVLNHAIEFSGEGLEHLSVAERLTIANMTTEWGALVGLFPIDAKTLGWLRARREIVGKRGPAGVPSDADGQGANPRLNDERIRKLAENTPRPDGGAFYAKTLTLDLSTVRPHVSGPNHVKVMTSVTELEARNIKVNKAYLVSCVNSRVDDLTAAAEVVRGKKIAEGVDFYIAAASSEFKPRVSNEATGKRWWRRVPKSSCPGAAPVSDWEPGFSRTARWEFPPPTATSKGEWALAPPRRTSPHRRWWRHQPWQARLPVPARTTPPRLRARSRSTLGRRKRRARSIYCPDSRSTSKGRSSFATKIT